MKKYFLLLVTLLGLLTTACDNSFEEPKKETPTGSPIAMIEEQMSSIKSSLPKLQNTANEAKALVAEPMSETRGDGNNGVKSMIEALEERIKALEEYVAGGGEGDWMDTTYATLDMYEETIALLAELQAEIESFKAQNEAQYEDIMESIEKSVDSMKSWVNELFTGYYDIATIDAMFAKILDDLTAEDAAIRSEIETLRKELDKQFDDMEDAYRDAIREAIEENNGKLSEQLTKEIEAVNSRIDDEVEKLNKRLDDIEERLSKLEDSVSDLLKRIQSITYIPLYDDNTARVLCPNEGMEGSTVQLDFTISPRDAAEDLAAVWQEAVSVKALYTGSPVMTDLPVVSCTAYADQGLLSVVAACDNLSWEFYNEDVKARAIMYISDGNNDLTSEYIPMIPQRSQIPNNQIWYTVTGKTPVDIQQGSGPKIVSNTFDPSNEVYVVTFEEDIYSIPADYFGGKSELKTVVLPNSVSSLDDNSFSGCHNLSDISLGMSLGYIGSRAFEGCTIHTLNLPASLYGVNSEAFAGSSIAQFTGDMVADDGISLILDKTLVAIAPAGIGAEYSVPAEAESIRKGVFRDFNSIEQFSGKFATEDGYALVSNGTLMVFAKACGIDEYTIPADITYIEDRVFANCSNISLFRFESTTPPTLGANVFAGIDNLQISIPKEAVEVYLTCDWPYDYRRAIIELADINNIPDSCRLYYTTNNNQKLGVYPEDGYTVLSHDYSNGQGIIVFFEPLTTIGGYVFRNCSSLTSITIPDGVTSIAYEAFYHCSSLTSVTIGNSVTSIGHAAFSECYDLTSVTIPDSVTTIGDFAFSSCDSLTSLTIGDSVTSIGDEAFAYCASLTSVTIPDSVTTIGNSAFRDCRSLTSVTIGDSVTSIGEGAFYCCHSLTSVTIPDSVTTIGEGAFSECRSLTSVTIPDSVTTIGSYAFSWCSSLQEFNGKFASEDGRCLIVDGMLNSFAIGCGATEYAIPDSVTTIEEHAFQGCYSLTSVTIPDSVTTIGSYAFASCDSLTSITIGDSVTTIGDAAFYNCSSLTSVYISDISAWCNISFSDSYSNPLSNGSNLYLNNELVTDLTIPDSVTTIGYSAFCYCDSLTSVTIPDSVTTIGSYAFAYCSSLTSITIPDSVTTIGGSAFYDCSSLTSVTIPDSVTKIGNFTFYGCRSLTSVTIPDSTTTIGEMAFCYCRSLTSVIIPDSVTTIGYGAFGECTSLTSVTIGNSVTTIGEMAFLFCSSLTSVYCKAITPPAGDSSMFDVNASGRKIYVPMESVNKYKSASGWSAYKSFIVGYDFE